MKFYRRFRYGFCLFIIAFFLMAARFPQPQGHINDFAGKLSRNTLYSAEALAREVQQKTQVEIAVAILPDLQGETVETAALHLFEQWKIGSQQEDNGLLFLVGVQERKAKIEVGYGLEGILPDGKVGAILDQYVVPFLKQNDYNTAVQNAVLASGSIIAQAYNVQLTGQTAMQRSAATRRKHRSALPTIIVMLILLVVLGSRRFFMLLMLSGGMRRGSWTSGGSTGDFGGFGGGFGGFGGGSSGGGGASRSF